jgi:hypothetical protein
MEPTAPTHGLTLAATLQEHGPYPSSQKQEKWVDEREINHRIGNVVGLIHTLVAIGSGNCRKRDADLPSKCCWMDAAKSLCIMNANVTGRRGEALPILPAMHGLTGSAEMTQEL